MALGVPGPVARVRRRGSSLGASRLLYAKTPSLFANASVLNPAFCLTKRRSMGSRVEATNMRNRHHKSRWLWQPSRRQVDFIQICLLSTLILGRYYNARSRKEQLLRQTLTHVQEILAPKTKALQRTQQALVQADSYQNLSIQKSMLYAQACKDIRLHFVLSVIQIGIDILQYLYAVRLQTVHG